ncbi:MAG: phenylacetate--CoA ligase family protein [Chitinophagaceae bacterium]
MRDGKIKYLYHKNSMKFLAKADLSKSRDECIRKILTIHVHAFRTCRYYKELWESIGYNPEITTKSGSIVEIPLLTKDIIESQKTKMISSLYKLEDLEKSFTGGTSGNPTSFYRNRECTIEREGRLLGILELCGYRASDRCGLIWGAHQDFPGANENQGIKARIRKFTLGKEKLCCNVLTPEMLREYHDRLRRFQPDVLYGYPNAIREFAEYIQGEKLEPITVGKIYCTAERLSEATRKKLEEVFSGEVFNLYNTREHGCIGFECRRHNGFHIDIGNVYVEIMEDGKPVPAGQPGEIVVTDLLNYGMPFIRSRIGDRGVLSLEPCDCGIHLPLLASLEGRESDVLLMPDGSKVAGLMMLDMFEDMSTIKNIQIIQESLHEIMINLETAEEMTEKFTWYVKSQAMKFIGEGVNIVVNKVDQIPKNPISGKTREVVCKIKRNW